MGAYLPLAFQSNVPASTMMPPSVVPCPPKSMWQGLYQAELACLGSITIADLAKGAVLEG